MRLVDGVDIDRTYTADEVAYLFAVGKLRSVANAGYVARADWDGTCRFVHWTQHDANRAKVVKPQPGKAVITDLSNRGARTYEADFDPVAELREGLPPVRRRTPAERVASLAARIQGQTRLVDPTVDPDSGEATRMLAAEYLGQAEKDLVVNEMQTRLKGNRKQRRADAQAERRERRQALKEK